MHAAAANCWVLALSWAPCQVLGIKRCLQGRLLAWLGCQLRGLHLGLTPASGTRPQLPANPEPESSSDGSSRRVPGTQVRPGSCFWLRLPGCEPGLGVPSLSLCLSTHFLKIKKQKLSKQTSHSNGSDGRQSRWAEGGAPGRTKTGVPTACGREGTPASVGTDP